MSKDEELADVKLDMPYHLKVSGVDAGSSDQEEASDCNCMMDEVTCTPMDVSELDLKKSWRKGAFSAVVSLGKMSGPLILFIVVCVIITLVCRSYINDLIITLEELPVWESLLVFLALYTLVSFPFAFGCIVLNMACGYLYGMVEGTLIAIVATEFGYLVVFYLSRRCLRRYAETQVSSPYLVSVMRVMEGPNGLKVTILFRLMPLPLGVQNSILALSSVGVFSSSVGSLLGFLPTQLLYCYLGSTVHNMQELLADRVNAYIVLIVQVLASILLVYYVVRKARIEFAKLAAEQELKATQTSSILQTEEKLKVPLDIESGIS